MDLFFLIVRRLNVIGNFKELGTDRQRKETLIGLAATQLLVQLASMPIALVIPSVARHFDVNVAEAAWMVVIRLLMLGSTVFLAARLGQKYGHARIYFIGAIVLSGGSVMAATSFSTMQLILWSGLVGIGGAMVTANSNAILSMVFPAEERGRAFAVPVVAARFGTLIGLGMFGLFLQFFSLQWGWRMVFLSSLPIGLLAIYCSLPLLKYHVQQNVAEMKQVSINYVGAILMVATLGTFILSGLHIHEGAESFTTPDALGYHIPMHLLFFACLALFFVIQQRSSDPFVQFGYFKQKYFSMALFTNTCFHLSMLAVTTLIPILVENGLGQPPIFVALVLLPNQVLGLFLPTLGGWIHDRHDPRWLRPASLLLIASGFFLAGFFADDIPVLALPLLLLPIAIGSNMFNSPNNATVMNSLPDNRSFASGMLETTRQMGHSIGTTVSATVLGLALPVAIDLLPRAEAQTHYLSGFQISALAVVWIMMSGGIVAIFQRTPTARSEQPRAAPAPQPGGGDN
ncbi:MAG: MFS transporter [Chloroflexi bacterium]|nr:MFS transporter [Chloroflexota bacterium]